MFEKDRIIITEKPNDISWDEIHECLWASHAYNREKGVLMKFPSLPGEEIKKRIEKGNGKMYVALDGDKLAGVAGYQIKQGKGWYCKTQYLYLCFAGVLPEYAGQGIYKQLYIYIERERERRGLPVLIFDTHEKNVRIIKIHQKNGFVKVDYKRYGDHFNVVLAEWRDGCQFSQWYVCYRFLLKKWLLKLKYFFC